MDLKFIFTLFITGIHTTCNIWDSDMKLIFRSISNGTCENFQTNGYNTDVCVSKYYKFDVCEVDRRNYAYSCKSSKDCSNEDRGRNELLFVTEGQCRYFRPPKMWICNSSVLQSFSIFTLMVSQIVAVLFC